MPIFLAKPILADLVSVKEVQARILNALRYQTGPQMVQYANKTVQTWKGKPTFTPRLSYRGGDVAVVLELSSGHDADKWFWICYGTRVRYARLSKDWRSKTVPGRISARGGRGMAFKSRYPFKGIQARRWDTLIAKQMRPHFNATINRAVREGMKAAKQKGKL